jgi:murein hydrolase activator
MKATRLLPVLAAVMIFWLGEDGLLYPEPQDAPAGRLTQQERELQHIRKKIETERARIEETHAQEKQVLSDLDQIEEALARKQKELKQYEGDLQQQGAKIETLGESLASLEQEMGGYATTLSHRIAVLYKVSRGGVTNALLAGDSFPETLRKYMYLTRVIDYNAGVLALYARKIERVSRTQQELKENELRLEDLTTQARSVREKILGHQEEKAALLAKVKSEKELHLKALEELEQASGRLQALINRLEKGSAASSTSVSNTAGKRFSALKGLLDFPAEGRVMSLFGKQEDPEFSTVSFNRGIEIKAQAGAPIKAVLGGTVIYSGWFKGYGNIIILDHGEGYYTLSGHAAELLKEVGQTVGGGEEIGLVGETGSLRGPNLYFEIRRHGQPLDPLDWLKKKQ